MKYKNKTRDLRFSQSDYFKTIYDKNKKIIEDEEQLLIKTKEEIMKLNQLFSEEKIEMKLKNNSIKNFIETEEEEGKLEKEIKNLYKILNDRHIPEDKIKDLI